MAMAMVKHRGRHFGYMFCSVLLSLLVTSRECQAFLSHFRALSASRSRALFDTDRTAPPFFPNNQSFVDVETTWNVISSANQNVPPTPPEVNEWTSIMSHGFPETAKEGDLEQLYLDLKDMSDFDRWQVENYWDRMMPTVSYLGTEDNSKVYDALRVAYRAHRGQMRKSGEPFIIHPIEVALLLSGLKMDTETVMAGLLHDTVEDTDLTFDQVEAIFGPVVRSIVEGETKVSKLPKLAFSDYADEQAENLRQMFVAMTDDYRIIIVKLADRLHNMRTLRHMKPHKQIKISRETLDIFAPLAHRMGIWQFKSELEDTAFMYLYPQEYKRLNRRLKQYQDKFQMTLEKSQEILTKTLNSDRVLREQSLEVKVAGRTKEIYSLWQKMTTKGEHNLDNIVDVVALRVIITPKPQDPTEDDNYLQTDRGVWLCYHALGVVQHLPGFQPVPTRVKDYISFPKPNGYQSLHTALMLNGQTIEVQIRTNKMHQIAEYGMASHWAYKDEQRRTTSKSSGSAADVFNTPWLASIKEWQDDQINSRDFVDSVRKELLGKRVFAFLRNGKILNLARGATVIDAAFQIHTEVGLNMHGAEINGKPVPFSYELRNGDVVSILTGHGKPATDWMRYAKSRSTRSKLRSYFRVKEKESLREAGKILVMDYLWIHGPLIESNSHLERSFVVPTTTEELAAFLPGKSRYNSIGDLLLDVGKQQDRSVLHTAISKIFLVSQRKLIDAEKNRTLLVPTSVAAAVLESLRLAQDAAAAAGSANDRNRKEGVKSTERAASTTNATSALPHPFSALPTTELVEFADPDHLCGECLPVFGDEIVGTKSSSEEAATTVHRVGCPHALRAVHAANARRIQVDPKKDGSVDSISLRVENANRFSKIEKGVEFDRPVKLEWADSLAGIEEKKNHYMVEVVVVCQDRKLLLADCSEVVSEMSEIVKTGSATSKEHATLLFLVKVSSLEDLQSLMDRLNQVRSVMSVERRFGSELL